MENTIDVFLTAQQAAGHDFSSSTVVVIDVLRATSVMTAALNNGAQCIYATAEVDQAKAINQSLCNGQALLGGERNALRIPGFDLDNSPLAYSRQVVEGRQIVMTTTNGTLAIANSSSARRMLLASLLNVDSVAKAILADEPRPVVIVCAGTEGTPTLEDNLCAAILADRLQYFGVYSLCPALEELRTEFSDNDTPLFDKYLESHHAQNLISKGFAPDVIFCSNIEANLKAVEYKNGKIVLCE